MKTSLHPSPTRSTRVATCVALACLATGCIGKIIEGAPADEAQTGAGGTTSSVAGSNTSGGSAPIQAGSGGTGTATGGSGTSGTSGTGGSGGTAGSAGTGGVIDPTTATCNAGPYPAKTELHRLTPLEYKNAIRDIFDGKVAPSSQYPGAYGQSATGYSTEEAINEVGEQSTEQLMNAAEDVALSLADALPDLLPCADDADDACRDTFLTTFATRAYRRPLTSEEQASLTAAYSAAIDDGASFSEAMAVMSTQLLQSPQFLYWVEDAANSQRKLTSYELASRLSFLLWDSVPDDELLAAAATDSLADNATLGVQAQRLLASPKADSTLARLLREWTQALALTPSDKDANVFPEFTSDYAASLNESFDRFAVDQLRNQGTLTTLLTSNTAFVDDQIADSYGATAPGAGKWQSVTLDATRYAGITTQALLLATDAHSNTSSYVFRGRMLRKRLLCEDFGPPPPNAQAAFAAIELPENPTGKETAAGIEAQAACRGCHAQLDPVGLAFEHFDAIGRYRETYDSGRAIDTSGTLEVASGTYPFASNVELAGAMAGLPELKACFARQLFRFAFSRVESNDDVCALKALEDSLTASGGDLGQAFLTLITTDAFSWRADP